MTEDITISPTEQLLDLIDNQRALPLDDCPVPVAFLTGVAGTGKTRLIQDLIDTDNKFGELSATTGIAAVNLGCGTINSLLKYFDSESLVDQYVSGRLNANIHKLGHQVENIIIDEISMMPAQQLKLIYQSVADVNDYDSMKDAGRRLGIIITGDFCQLPPVKASFAFESDIWQHFARKVVRLDKVWRQSDPGFLKAMQALRAGDGPQAAELLRSQVKWKAAIDRDFDGTTIVAKNDEVNRHNWLSLSKLPGEVIRIPSKSWGVLADAERGTRNKGEWKNIPEVLEIKIGAYVMILANKHDGDQIFYANGDCGHVTELDMANKQVLVKLKRTGETVRISAITRKVHVKDQPENVDIWDGTGGWNGKDAYYDDRARRWAIGGLTYIPLRLAYATTVHKCQGLTLDKIQVDSRAHFFGEAGMAYVALSRARRPEDTYIVGTPSLFATKVKIDERVRKWL